MIYNSLALCVLWTCFPLLFFLKLVSATFLGKISNNKNVYLIEYGYVYSIIYGFGFDNNDRITAFLCLQKCEMNFDSLPKLNLPNPGAAPSPRPLQPAAGHYTLQTELTKFMVPVCWLYAILCCMDIKIDIAVLH